MRQSFERLYITNRRQIPAGMAGGAVRTKGLEPPRLTAPDPKSGTSTNSATSAKQGAKLIIFFIYYASLFPLYNCSSCFILKFHWKCFPDFPPKKVYKFMLGKMTRIGKTNFTQWFQVTE